MFKNMYIINSLIIKKKSRDKTQLAITRFQCTIFQKYFRNLQISTDMWNIKTHACISFFSCLAMNNQKATSWRFWTHLIDVSWAIFVYIIMLKNSFMVFTILLTHRFGSKSVSTQAKIKSEIFWQVFWCSYLEKNDRLHD